MGLGMGAAVGVLLLLVHHAAPASGSSLEIARKLLQEKNVFDVTQTIDRLSTALYEEGTQPGRSRSEARLLLATCNFHRGRSRGGITDATSAAFELRKLDYKSLTPLDQMRARTLASALGSTLSVHDSVEMLRLAAKWGDSDAMLKLSEAAFVKESDKKLYTRPGQPPHLEKGEPSKQLREAAAAGLSLAQGALGAGFFDEGLLMDEARPKTREEAIEWLRKASEGDGGAKDRLAKLLFATGKAEDRAEAERLRSFSGAYGHGPVYTELARRLLTGDGIKRDKDEAVRTMQVFLDKLATTAYKQQYGSSPLHASQFRFARMLLDDGESGELFDRGLQWLERAADGGDTDAQFWLARLLLGEWQPAGRPKAFSRDAAAASRRLS